MAMVENCFDRWQKDVFFSAAEAVQESADVMQSVYRMWERERREGLHSNDSDELLRELHTALGTTKWQLEEFERAVKLTHRNGSSDNTISRHRQFIEAIEDQVFHVEKALRDSLIEEGKQPFQWIQLDEEERDDLAMFLSPMPGTSQETEIGHLCHAPIRENNISGGPSKGDADVPLVVDYSKGFKEVVTIHQDSKYIVELEAEKKDAVQNVGEGSNGSTKTWSLPDVGSWKIVIADEDIQRKSLEPKPEMQTHAFNLSSLLTSIESATKSKWLRNNFPKVKGNEDLLPNQVSNYLNSGGITRVTQGISMLTERSRNCFSSCEGDSNVSRVRQLFGRVGGFKRQVQGTQYLPFGRTLQMIIVIMLTIFITAPFVLYSN